MYNLEYYQVQSDVVVEKDVGFDFEGCRYWIEVRMWEQ